MGDRRPLADAADWIRRRIEEAVDARGACHVALAGGSTPRPVYERLGAGPLPWDRLDWWFGDERAVPPDHSESNYRMVLDTLRPKDLARVHRMPADAPDLEAAADDYGRRLPPQLDLLVLGMGPDGHTASLFPGSPALDIRHRRVVPVIGPKPPPRRLTITPPVIEAARAIVVLAGGADKSAMVARALEGPLDVKAVPAQLARRGAWFTG